MDFIRWTNTSIFIAPTLNIRKEDLSENNFINAFCSDLKKEGQYEHCVLLLFKPNNIYRFKLFVDAERERTHFLIDDYDYKGGYVVLVYMLDRKYDEDIAIIKKGKYSHVSDEFKQLFPKKRDVFINGKYISTDSIQWKIFEKENSLRIYWEDTLNVDFKEHMELWGGWDNSKEILDIDKIKE